jgi:CRP/FNR family transcriptional regulator
MSGELLRTATADDIPCFHWDVWDRAMCAALEPHELHRLNAIVTEVQLEKNLTVFHQEDPATHVFNVTGGVVRLSKMLGDGRRQVTGFMFPGDFFGVSYGDVYVYGAEAVNHVRLCRFPRDKLIASFDDMSKLERWMLAVASNELVAAQDQMLLLGRKTATEKLASFILLLARRADTADHSATSVNLPMTRMDIGDYLGLTTETVSRGLGKFVNDGLIELPSPGRILLKDRDALDEMAKGF